jgi:hypothetical protein
MLSPDQQAAIVALTDYTQLTDQNLHEAVRTFITQVNTQLSEGLLGSNAQLVLPRLETEVQNRVAAKEAAAQAAAQAALVAQQAAAQAAAEAQQQAAQS